MEPPVTEQEGSASRQRHSSFDAKSVDANGSSPLPSRVRKIRICTGWDAADDCEDTRTSLVFFDMDKRVIDYVDKQKARSDCGAFKHKKTDGVEQDCEVFAMNVSKVPFSVHFILCLVIVGDKGRNSSNLSSLYMRVTSTKGGQQIAHFRPLSFPPSNAILLGALCRNGSTWHLRPCGNGAVGRSLPKLLSQPTNLGALHNLPSRCPLVRTVKLKVSEGRNLVAMDSNGTSDPFVRIFWSGAGGKKSKIKTETAVVHQNIVNPRFVMAWLPLGVVLESDHKKVKFFVWDWDKLSADDFMGFAALPASEIWAMKAGTHERWLTLGPSKVKPDVKVTGQILVRVDVEDLGHLGE